MRRRHHLDHAPGTAPAPGDASSAAPVGGLRPEPRLTEAALTATAASVAALPGLPAPARAPDPAGGSGRYGVPGLTAAWLTGFSPHTRTAYFRDLALFLSWCQRDRLDPLAARPADLSRYRAAIQAGTGRPASPATVHRRLSTLSSWYRYLVANSDGAVAANPLLGVRRPTVDRDASATVGLTGAEVRELLRAADAVVARRRARLSEGATPGRVAGHLAALRDRALLRLLADLGLRIGEALALDLPALTHNRGRPTLRYLGKGGKLRERPLTGHSLLALEEYLAARAAAASVPPDRLTGPLLATTGRAGRAGRMTEPAAFRLVRRLARHAGLPSAERLSPHSLRHAFATNARELGIALEDVQDAMGHADARTTRRYDRARYALERDPALRLADLYAAGAGHPGQSAE